MDLRQTRSYGDYMCQQSWIVEKINTTSQSPPKLGGEERSSGVVLVFIRKIPLLPWSIMKIQRWNGRLDFEKLNQIKRKYKVIYAVLEPRNTNLRSNEFTKLGFKLSSSPYLPMKTIVVDLTKPEEQLLKEMSKDARQKLKKTNLRIKELTKLEEFQEFGEEWKKQRKGYVPSLQSLQNLKKSFGDRSWILTADTIGVRPSSPSARARFAPFKVGPPTMVAGTIVLLSDDTAYYYFAWTNGEGRKSGAQYKLVWEAMKWAKKMGLKKFDFEGIYDERWPLPRWKGFTAFKKKWGGKEVEYPGSWQKWF